MIFSSERRNEQMLALGLVVAGVLTRLLPHPQNFSPVTALALFAGVCLRPRLALTVPLLVMMISDIWKGSHGLLWLTWGSFMLVALIGLLLKNRARAGALAAGSLAGSLIFYLLTNLGVFFFQDMYPKTAQGLLQCYVMALPFLRNAVAGDLFYTAAVFGIFLAARRALPAVSRV